MQNKGFLEALLTWGWVLPKFKKLLSHFDYRKLQVHILTIFLVLFSLGAGFIITYTYFKHSKAILEFSKGTIDRVSMIIIEKISHLTEYAEFLPELGADFLTGQNISPENKDLIAFLFDVVKTHKHLDGFYVGTETGDMIQVVDLLISGQTHFLRDPSKLLPTGSRFALRIIDRSKKPATEVWTYKNDQYQTLASESISNVTYDPRVRPWYVGVKKEGKPFGTDVYHFDPTEESGITIAAPIFNASGEIVAVVGGDLTLQLLSKFLIDQKIGKTGKAVVLDRFGKIIFPEGSDVSPLTSELASMIFAKYKAQEDQYEYVIEHKGIDYLASVDPFPITVDKDWLITIYAPLSDFFGEMLNTQKKVSYFSFIILVIAAFFIVFFSRRISSPIVKLAEEVDKIKHLNFDSEARVESNIKEISLMDSSIASMRTALRSFGRYVPKDIVKGLIEKGQEIALGGEKKEITAFFSDIEGFTAIAEPLSTDELMALLAEYFDQLSKIILEHDGTIDKYIGDSIMAFWGAPNEVPNQAYQACIAALLCHHCIVKINKRRREEGKPEFRTRFGIHTGNVVVGNIGTLDRMNYTVIGDVVNTTSRLQTINKDYHTWITLSEEVYKKVSEQFLVRPLDFVAVRGRKEKIKIYELVAALNNGQEIQAQKEQIELCKAFREAYDVFYEGQFEKAQSLFKEIQKKFPSDYPTQIYLKRIEEKLSAH